MTSKVKGVLAQHFVNPQVSGNLIIPSKEFLKENREEKLWEMTAEFQDSLHKTLKAILTQLFIHPQDPVTRKTRITKKIPSDNMKEIETALQEYARLMVHKDFDVQLKLELEFAHPQEQGELYLEIKVSP